MTSYRFGLWCLVIGGTAVAATALLMLSFVALLAIEWALREASGFGGFRDSTAYSIVGAITVVGTALFAWYVIVAARSEE